MIQGDLPWRFIGVGIGLGVVLVIVDELLRRTKRYSLPPLGVGIAIYLPAAVTLPVVAGAVIGWAYDQRVAKGPHGPAAQRLGVLLASGFIVGESLFNVALAGLIVATNNPSPIAVAPAAFPEQTMWLGAAFVALMIFALYAWSEATARKLPPG